MEVTGVSLRAALSTLLGTRLAAVTAVCDQADADRAPGWGLGALAGPLAVLSPCVGLCRGWDSAGHGEGGLGSGLQIKKQLGERHREMEVENPVVFSPQVKSPQV